VRVRPLLRSSAFRLTLLYAAVFEISVAVLFAVIYWGAIDRVRSQLDEQIERELSALHQEYRFGGIFNLLIVLTDRVSAPGTGFFYKLQAPNGNRLAGNLGDTRVAEGWSEIAHRPRGRRAGQADIVLRTRAVTLSNGAVLAVGQSTETVQQVRELVIRAFLWAAAVTLVLALAGGALVSARFLRRVEAVERAAGEIIDGRFDRRLPVRGSGDEFDRLAGNVNRMLDRIEALLENLKQATNDIAHDLRTPVARLRQRIEGARLHARSVADYEAATEQALTDIDGILRTFTALLRIAQIEAGTRRAGFAEVDLSGVFTTMLEVYGPVAEDRGQSLGGTVAPGIAFRGDREMLTQMLANLVENAIRHSPAPASIEVSLTSGDGGAVGTIADNGPGIPAEQRERVLRRFYRLDSSRTTPGSGLGLSLASAVAQLHGIAMELGDNAPGLRVTLRFPRSEVRSAA
jgi:signal transduction histidine kinase